MFEIKHFNDIFRKNDLINLKYMASVAPTSASSDKFNNMNIEKFDEFIENYCPTETEYLNLEVIKQQFLELSEKKDNVTRKDFDFITGEYFIHFKVGGELWLYKANLDTDILKDFWDIFTNKICVICKYGETLILDNSEFETLKRRNILYETYNIPKNELKSLVGYICHGEPIMLTVDNIERFCEYATKFNIKCLCDQGFALACDYGRLDVAKAIYDCQSKLLEQSYC